MQAMVTSEKATMMRGLADSSEPTVHDRVVKKGRRPRTGRLTLAFAFMLPLTLAVPAIAGCGGSTPAANPPTPIVIEPVSLGDSPTDAPMVPSMVPPPETPKPLLPAKVFAIDKLGVKAIGIASNNLPIVYVHVRVRAGAMSAIVGKKDGQSLAGLAELTAKLMKDGGAGPFDARALADRTDALGTDIGVSVGLDSVDFSIAVTKDKVDAALDLLSAVVLHPRFDAGEFGKLKARELDRVGQQLKSSGMYTGGIALSRALFGEESPYGAAGATTATIGAIELADVRAFYKKMYVARNALIVVAGDIDAGAIGPKLQRTLSGFSTAAPPTIPALLPPPFEGTRVILVSKPGAKQTDVFVGALAMPRSDPHWADLALDVSALGGTMSSRLFRDVREERSLAYGTSASLRERASGPSTFTLYAGTQTKKAPQSVVALLENLHWMSGDRPITEEELSGARNTLRNEFIFQLETIDSVARLAADKEILGLPGDDVYGYVEGYRRALSDATLESVRAVGKTSLAPKGMVIVVAGDPHLAVPLSHFGDVKVLDPEHGFAVTASLPKDEKASLDVPLPPGE